MFGTEKHAQRKLPPASAIPLSQSLAESCLSHSCHCVLEKSRGTEQGPAYKSCAHPRTMNTLAQFGFLQLPTHIVNSQNVQSKPFNDAWSPYQTWKIPAPHYLFSASSLLGPRWETGISLLRFVVYILGSSCGIKCCGYKLGIGVC